MRDQAKHGIEMNGTKTMNRIETMGGAMAVTQGLALRRWRQGLMAVVAALATGICLLMAAAGAEAAPYGIESASVNLSTAQAGAHPDMEVNFKLTQSEATGKPEFGAHTVVTDLPVGFVGNVNNFSTCPMDKIIQMTISGANAAENAKACPRTATVGYLDAGVRYGYAPLGFTLRQRVYRLPSDPGEPAAFGTSVVNNPVKLSVSVRSDGDYGVRVTSQKLPESVITESARVVIWGMPAEHQGGGPTAPLFDGNPVLQTKPANEEQRFGVPLEGMPHTPLLTNPTSCPNTPLLVQLSVSSWADPYHLIGPADAPSAPIEGCEKVAFEPTISVTPDSSRAGQPSGVEVNVAVPQTNDARELATSHLKDAVVTLPKGMTLSPPLAEGLAGCTDAQLGLHSKAAESCPPASKIGTVQLDTPLLEAPMSGSLYAGSQESSDPLSGQMYRMFLALEGSGVRVKLAGQIKVDPATGQITTSFANNPQLPFSNLALKFKGGDRAPLVLPATCGNYRTVADFSGWSDPANPVHTWSSFKVDQNCGNAAAFTPGFSAGTTNPVGGSYSPFTLRVTRPDGQQNVSSLRTTLPEGLLAKLAGVPLCPDAAATTGNCPAASQVGSATVAAGAGSNPLYVPQPGKAPTALYLAGPYKGGPYSLIAKVPAQAGPFDLGTVAVRNSIKIDPVSAQVAVASDALPQVLKGIPVAYRDIRVDVNRPQFTLNPTSCDPMAVDGTIASAQGASANVSDRFQVADCASLGFAPKLRLKLKGATRRGAYPALRAELKAKPGEANIDRVSVALPHSEFLAQEHIRTVCTRVQFAAEACPAGSIYGYARAFTPLLDKPLEGPVYLRSSSNPLPDLVAALHGQIEIDLAGRIDSVNGGIRSTFEMVPDAPVSRFVLSMKGGRKGLLVNSRNLCRSANRASVKMDGQNGKTADQSPVLSSACGKKSKKSKRAHR
jgi:hypothetical protein